MQRVTKRGMRELVKSFGVRQFAELEHVRPIIARVQAELDAEDWRRLKEFVKREGAVEVLETICDCR